MLWVCQVGFVSVIVKTRTVFLLNVSNSHPTKSSGMQPSCRSSGRLAEKSNVKIRILEQTGWQTYLSFRRESPVTSLLIKDHRFLPLPGTSPISQNELQTGILQGIYSRCIHSSGAATVAYKRVSHLWTTPEEKLFCLPLTWRPG